MSHHDVLVDGDPVLARALRGVECLVGGLDQVVRGGRHVLGQGGDAEARRHATTVGELVRGEHVADSVGVEPRARFGRFHQEDGELVAAVAADDVDAARVPQENLRHAPKRLVARSVPELVVDRLEGVEIEQHDRDGVVEAAVA